MKLLVALCLLGLACAYTVERHEEIADGSWQQWKGTHSKFYPNINEEKVRYTIWQENLRKIAEHNAQNNGLTLKINHFGDLTNLEYRAMFNGYLHKKENGTTFLTPSHIEAPETVDWRDQGYVTPVKNQGQCGSCWAFSTTGSLEGQHFKKTGKLVSLSEQNLVDCSKQNNGCQGGLMDFAFAYIKKNGGIDTESSYPYKAVDGRCKYNSANNGATVTGFTDIPKGDEDALKNAIATVGPIAVAIDASHYSFQFYHSGVYNERQCSSTQLDHGVLAVGYGTYQGKDYWLVKNSWGTGWGLQGYIRMTRNKNNQCGIASSASYPLV